MLLAATLSSGPVVKIIIVIIVVGILLWAVNSYIPMAESIKKILNCVVVVGLIVWLLKVFGLWASIANIHF